MRYRRWLGVNYPNPVLSTTVPAFGPPQYLGPPVSSGTPTGTYTQSCQNIFYDPTTDTLTALCETMNGTWQQSTLFNANGYVPGSIFNQNGQLGGQPMSPAVSASSPQQPTIVAPDVTPPPGGYQQIEAPGSPYVYVGPGQAPIAPNTYPGYSPYYNPAVYGSSYGSQGLTPAQQLAISDLAASSGGSSAGSSSFSNFWNNYKVPILVGLGALIVVPPLLKRVTR